MSLQDDLRSAVNEGFPVQMNPVFLAAADRIDQLETALRKNYVRADRLRNLSSDGTQHLGNMLRSSMRQLAAELDGETREALGDFIEAE